MQEMIPAELRRLPQWVVWRREKRAGKTTKVPYYPRTGRRASVVDPRTWSTFDEASAAATKYDGVGFVLTVKDPYVGIDLDHCRDPQTGTIEPWAQEIIELHDTYTEISPSKTGIRIFARGTLPPGGRKRGPIEMYNRDRFLTVTGDHLAGTPSELQDRTPQLAALHLRIFGDRSAPPATPPVPPEPVDLPDPELLDRARQAKNGERFARLWRGDITGYPSPSEADLALCTRLAFWTGCDAPRIDRLFRQSGLFRPKWDEVHYADRRTYGQATIATAIASCPDIYRLPPLIHLVDLERTEYVGRTVRADLVIAGVGETFHVPQAWQADCGKARCKVCPTMVDLGTRKELLNFCRMSDDQRLGFMRRLTGCKSKPKVRPTVMTTISELLAVPTASPTFEGPTRDYREKIVAFLGSLPKSDIRYRATGQVIAEPKGQRASLLITTLDRLQSATDRFTLTPALQKRFRVFQVPSSQEPAVDAAYGHALRLTQDVTTHITKIYGPHRLRVLLAELLTFHSPANIPWDEEAIKGVLEMLVIGDTGQGKTTQIRRPIRATGLGQFASGSTSSRTGVLYHLDSKINDKRILRWGAFPLAHGELLALDEAQNIPREQWREFTTARSEGILKVDRAIRAEHPSRVRLVCFANPPRAMAEYQYGIMTVHPESGFLDPQDLRRFDLVICVAKEDQEAKEILAPPRSENGDPLIPADLLRESILWAWTRRIEHLRYAPGAQRAIRELAVALNEIFGTPEIPLLITDAHEKVARLAFAFAALLHSTDETHEHVIVTPIHVWCVARLIQDVYKHPNCAFDQYALVLQRRAGLTEEEYRQVKAALLTRGSNREDLAGTEAMLDLFLTEDDIPRSDVEAATGLGKDALTRRLGKLRKYRLIRSGRRGYRKTARFVAFLRKWNRAG